MIGIEEKAHMISAYRAQDTSPLFGLNQIFELEPRWGSPIFEEDNVLVLSDYGQETRIRLVFTEDSSKVLLGRDSTRSTYDLSASTTGSDSEGVASMTALYEEMSNLATTEEEREQAESLLNAVLTFSDLQPFSADVFGVSRQHVILERAGRHMLITDLHSKNGTRLNGDLLCPLQHHVVRNGDALQLGALQLRVRFRRADLGN
jgi:hypothetical protein